MSGDQLPLGAVPSRPVAKSDPPESAEDEGRVERECGKCGGPTIEARSYTRSPSVPSRVQARCRNLSCSWKGEPVEVSA